MRTPVPLALSIALLACAPRGSTRAAATPLPTAVAQAEATSLLGEPLVPAPLAPDVRRTFEERLAAAQADVAARPDDPDALVWLGRRTAYLGRYRESIDVFTRGVERHPGDARFLRHRGHRYITTRQFARAIADLEAAARLVAGRPDEVEPDGLPNARNVPTSTLQSNIWYHLGLAHYLSGDFERALRAYRECLAVSANPDMLVATSHWLYMTLRRLGRDAEAARVLEPIRRDMDVIENGSYHRLLLLYRGELPLDTLTGQTDGSQAIDDATVGYGVGNWHLYNGRRAEAEQLFRRIVAGDAWAAFGFIAAEAELHRMGASAH